MSKESNDRPPSYASTWEWIIDPSIKEYKHFGDHSKQIIKHPNGLIVYIRYNATPSSIDRTSADILNITLEYEPGVSKAGHPYWIYKIVARQVNSDQADHLLNSQIDLHFSIKLKKAADSLAKGKELSISQKSLWDLANSLGFNPFTYSE